MNENEEIEQRRRKFIAKMLTIHGYRNSPIEDLHAGIPLPEKYKHPKYSKITDAEMKHLNKTIFNQVYTILTMMENGSFFRQSYFTAGWGHDWDEPELLDWQKNEE